MPSKDTILTISLTLCAILMLYIYMVQSGKLYTESQLKCLLAASANVDYLTLIQQADTFKKGK